MLLLRNYRNVWIMRGLFGKQIQITGPENYLLGVYPKSTSKMSLLISLHVHMRRHAVTADKNCIPIKTNESRFSKITELIKSKNISFERFSKCRTAKILVFRLLGFSLRQIPGKFCISD